MHQGAKIKLIKERWGIKHEEEELAQHHILTILGACFFSSVQAHFVVANQFNPLSYKGFLFFLWQFQKRGVPLECNKTINIDRTSQQKEERTCPFPWSATRGALRTRFHEYWPTASQPSGLNVGDMPSVHHPSGLLPESLPLPSKPLGIRNTNRTLSNQFNIYNYT